jgi:raffinose/stachyose/melibiose transport system permease protein
MLRTRAWVPYLYVAPMVALLGFIFAYPIAKLFEFSFRLIRGVSGPWVGTLNYRNVFEDPTFREAAIHSLTLLLAVPIMTATSLVVSVLLYERVRGWRAYRTLFFLPFILAIPIVGIVFGYIFQLNGVLNELLRDIGLGALALDWLGSERLALWTVMFVIVWREVGFGIILFLARLLTMNQDLIEAAKIDGASWWKRLRHVIVPQLKGTIEFYVVIAVITMLASVFAYVFTITHGGPGTATQIVELYIFNTGIRNSLPGMASAVAVPLLVTTLILIAAMFRIRAKATEEETA